uniref:phosphatidylinositol N-acetylglucosaminyltransferase n=1 Tax=Acrobeloides nanus TaxID=290746 RepID=A0A914CUX8_9BILA
MLYSKKLEKSCLRIALVSDFFCPNTGGIETHLYYLGGCLLERGHKVIVITHAYGRRKGIRYLSNGLKVYYLPFLVVYNSTTLSAVVDCLYWFRKIFLHEKIQIVHGHSSFSSMAHEAILHAWCLGIRTIFTDHSLFGFADASAILTSKLLLRYSLANVDKAICVSHTSKENLVLRAGLSPSNVFVVPNAIETSLFLPDPEKFYSNTTTVVILSRLVYRKGADLLVDIIPLVCQQHPKVRFLIAGDGPKRVELEEMREKHKLHNRVIMLGMLPHDKVREVMVEGQIFLNTSLTEAFCMSIVEAACCGLHVVSTKVGGVPEVLPSELVILEDTIPSRLSEGVLQAIYLRETNQLMDPSKRHEMVKKMYNWQDVAARTEIVYETAIATPQSSLKTRMKNYLKGGICFGLVWSYMALINLIFIFILNVFNPVKDEP